MSEDELARTLREAFDARARDAVADDAVPPAPRFAASTARGRHDLHHRPDAHARRHRRARVLAPLAAAAAVVAVGASVLALQGGSDGRRPAAGPHVSTVAGDRTPTSAPTSAASPREGTGAPVRIRLATADGTQYGVGMPVIAYFSRVFTDAGSLAAATSVSVDGAAVRAAWYFERSTTLPGFPVEGHLRLRGYWPAHAHVDVVLATAGVTAGTGLRFSADARVSFATGARTIGVVDARTHRLTVTRDGRRLLSVPVSLGAARTPTSRGVKVIISKQASACLRDAAGTYDQCGIKDVQRLTYTGEYLLGAPSDIANIKAGIDVSGGSTALEPADATQLYRLLEVGDVVDYPNADGPAMRPGSGYGDWNVPWSTWLTGGIVATHGR